MHNAEASGSDDSDEEEDVEMDKALAEAVLESELEFGQVPQLDPAKQREQDIIAEVARRRKEMEATATKKKSDEIFEHFDGTATTKHCEGLAL